MSKKLVATLKDIHRQGETIPCISEDLKPFKKDKMHSKGGRP